MTRTQIIVTIGTAFLSFVGALLGVYSGSLLDQGNWETRFRLEQRKVILERRIAVMERIAISFNKASVATGLRATVEFERASTELNVACIKLSMTPGLKSAACKQATALDPTRMESIAREFHALSAEFNATLVLAALYFGPETKAAITDMGTDPWSAGSAKYQRLMDSMGRELAYFPE